MNINKIIKIIFALLIASIFIKNLFPLIAGIAIISLIVFIFKKLALNYKTMSIKNISNINFKFNPSKKMIYYISAGFIILILLGLSIKVIPAGTTGVYDLFGKIRDKEVRSGIHLINPLARLHKMTIRTEEYTMSIAQGEGRKSSADAITALTKEGLSVDLDITVLYKLIEEKASDVYKTVGMNYEEKIIRPQIRSGIREVIARYDAKAIYSDKRAEAALKILEYLKSTVEPRGIEVEEVLLRHVELPANLKQAIEEKLQAEQEAQRMEFVLQKEQQEAERKRIEAQGQKDAQSIINQSLTSKYLNYLYITQLEKLDGAIYVPINPNNGMPLFRGVE